MPRVVLYLYLSKEAHVWSDGMLVPSAPPFSGKALELSPTGAHCPSILPPLRVDELQPDLTPPSPVGTRPQVAHSCAAIAFHQSCSRCSQLC
jgi:hypothetical protein